MRNNLSRRENDNFGLGLFDEFDDFFKPVFFNRKSGMQTDVKETDKGYEFSVDMPGYDKKDIELSLNNGYLTLSAKREEKEEDGNSFIRRERSCSCSRSFYVGDNVKEEDVKAKYENGTLNMFVPKAKPKELPNKHINID